MMSRLAELWSGRLPLAVAFWNYTIFWGLLLNLTATLVSLALLVAAGGTAGATTWAAALSAAVHLLPIPYNIICVVGVWRSAGRAGTSATEALLARAVVVGWSAVMTLI